MDGCCCVGLHNRVGVEVGSSPLGGIAGSWMRPCLRVHHGRLSGGHMHLCVHWVPRKGLAWGQLVVHLGMCGHASAGIYVAEGLIEVGLEVGVRRGVTLEVWVMEFSMSVAPLNLGRGSIRLPGASVRCLSPPTGTSSSRGPRFTTTAGTAIGTFNSTASSRTKPSGPVWPSSLVA